LAYRVTGRTGGFDKIGGSRVNLIDHGPKRVAGTLSRPGPNSSVKNSKKRE